MPPLKVFCSSWNAQGVTPTVPDVQKWVGCSDSPADIIAITVQEIVDLKPIDFVRAKVDLSKSKAKKWRNVIDEAVNTHPNHKGHKYVIVEYVTQTALIMMVLVRKALRSNVLCIDVGRSYGGTKLGTKGGVVVRFDYCEPCEEDNPKSLVKSLCFMGVHLKAHEGHDVGRNSSLKLITESLNWDSTKKSSKRANLVERAKSIRRASSYLSSRTVNSSRIKHMRRPSKSRARLNHSTEKKKSSQTQSSISSLNDNELELSVYEHDAVIVFGDLNYRVENVDLEIVLDHIQAGGEQMKTLMLNHDQLLRQMECGNVLQGFHEAEKNFPPTYKFKSGTDEYSSKAKRTPSWTDRVVFKGSEKITVEPLVYNSVPEIISSDHKPVFCSFEFV